MGESWEAVYHCLTPPSWAQKVKDLAEHPHHHYLPPVLPGPEGQRLDALTVHVKEGVAS